ncbi:hypothetical protein HORIV_13810 [Vreelandella olivaria]|uniref:Uncharacterized protein n=1 Tax=Vreelandella olivaria TaxID=390919 RepID=A0ABN5WR16_9GAMM|nr:hypothetical protein HORIV_13810 [Halomonas olivaria]
MGGVARIDFAFWQRVGIVRIAAIPVPHQLAGMHIKGTDNAGRFVGGAVIGDVAAQNDQILSDRRR